MEYVNQTTFSYQTFLLKRGIKSPSRSHFHGLTVEPLLEVSLLRALVEGALGVLVLDVDQPAPFDEHLGHLVVAPEARVVQRRVAVLVDKVHVGLVL